MAVAKARVSWVANLLAAGASSFEDGQTWVALGTQTNRNATNTTAQAADGTHSLQLSSVAGGDMVATVGAQGATPASTFLAPVVPGRAYSVLGSFRTAVTGRSCNVAPVWLDSTGAVLSTGAAGANVTDTAAGFTQAVSTNVVAPASSAYCLVRCTVVATGGAAEVHYVEKVAVLPGTSSTWSLGVGQLFSAWEVWRNDTGAYVQVASLPLSAASFDDYEVRRNVAATWEVRGVRTDGGISPFGVSGPLTVPLVAGRYVIGTNEVAAGGPAVEAADYSKGSNFTDRAYEFVLSSQELEFEGRDGAVVFLPTETEGDRFTAPLVLAAEGGEDGLTTTPATAGRAAFEALRALTRQPVSYLAVLDSDGGRWYANVRLENPTREEPGQLYTVDAVVRQTATAPSTPTSSP